MTPEPTTLRATREATIDDLCRRFAADELTLSELERRLEKARSARSRAELQRLVADLSERQGAASAVTREMPRGERPPARSSHDVPEAATSARPSTQAPGRVGDSARQPASSAYRVIGAFMGGSRRAGRWVPPSTMTAVAVMGGVELDFRDAVLEDEEVDITCFAFWGGVEIVVPPGVHVDTNGLALLGGFEQSSELENAPAPLSGAPVIRVSGVAIMGAVEVKVAESGQKVARDW